jgi:hypothetical protein
VPLKDWLGRLHKLKRLWQGDIVEDEGGAHSSESRAENGGEGRTSETLEDSTDAGAVAVDEQHNDGAELPRLPNLPGRLSAEDIVKKSLCDRKSAGKNQKKQS